MPFDRGETLETLVRATKPKFEKQSLINMQHFHYHITLRAKALVFDTAIAKTLYAVVTMLSSFANTPIRVMFYKKRVKNEVT